MVKKQEKTATPQPAQGRRRNAAPGSAKAVEAADTPFAEQVKTSAQQIWSAGLAAFAKAQDQGGGAVGKAEATLDTTARRMSDLAGEVGSRAGQHWDKLEAIFEDRVARALARLGMPAAEEVAQLKDRVEALSAEVAMLRAAQAGTKPKATILKAAKATPKPPLKPTPKTTSKTTKAVKATKGGKRTT